MCCSRLYGQQFMSVASDMRKLTHLMMMVNIDSFQMCPCLDDKHYPALLWYVVLLTSKWSCFNVRHDTVLLLEEWAANCTIYLEHKKCVNTKFKLIYGFIERTEHTIRIKIMNSPSRTFQNKLLFRTQSLLHTDHSYECEDLKTLLNFWAFNASFCFSALLLPKFVLKYQWQSQNNDYPVGVMWDPLLWQQNQIQLH